jgi:hypothetical protein
MSKQRSCSLAVMICVACTADDGIVTGAPNTTAMTSAGESAESGGETAQTGTDADPSADASDGSSSVADTSIGASSSSASESDPSADHDGSSEDGGLPEGLIATGELYPGDIVRLGDEIFWANVMDGDCIRRASLDGGDAADVACEPSTSTLPLQVIVYGDALAYSFMSTSGGGPSFGFGGVRLVDPAGGAPTTIDEGSRFESSASYPFCNDTLAASGTQLFWYAHELSEHASSIVYYDGNAVAAFDADSPFPYGVLATPTTIYWSATEAYYAKPLGALGGAPTPIGTTRGSSCGRTSSGETLWVSSRGTFATGPALFRFENGLFSNVLDLDEMVYDVAVDASYVYLAYESRIDRLAIADVGGAAETIVDGPTIGGILVDDGRLYWSDWYGGEVRYETL